MGAIGLRPFAPDKEESVKEFVSRNLGSEAFERLIEPFCSGVYAGRVGALFTLFNPELGLWVGIFHVIWQSKHQVCSDDNQVCSGQTKSAVMINVCSEITKSAVKTPSRQ